MDIGKEFLSLRVVRLWQKVPRDAVTAPASLEVSKARLGRSWSTL